MIDHRKTSRMPMVVIWVLIFLACLPSPTEAQDNADNLAPRISITYPNQGNAFSSECIKIKADAIDPDGSIVQVEFFAETNLIATVTNPPFNLVWQADRDGPINLTAVATDNSGAHTRSYPVRVYGGLLSPPEPVVELVGPGKGALFPAPATFVFSAELLASVCDIGPIDFFIDDLFVGAADPESDPNVPLSGATPLHSITVSNILEGEHKLSLRYRGMNGESCFTCRVATNTIRVVRLGIQSPRLTPERLFQFEVLTSFPSVETVIQTSLDLLDWTPISTNRPPTNSFLFTETSAATNRQRSYRVVLPSEPP